jgi:shikimate dehydrogenase
MRELPGRLVLIGHPVSHSLSPTFQNAALKAAGIAVRYEAVDTPEGLLHITLDEAKQDHWWGNVTVPYKEAVMARCHDLSPIAQRVGAANTFKASSSGISGHNTDVDGFSEAISLLVGSQPSSLTFGVIGAGGSAAAVVAAIESWPGCKALVTNRDLDRLDRLVERFSSVARPSDADEIARSADVIVNATSLGLREDDKLPIDPAVLRKDTALFDLVYTPNKTRLVREATARGIRADDGLSMLVGQGAAAFKWWFGVTPDRDVMWRSLARTAPSRISARR